VCDEVDDCGGIDDGSGMCGQFTYGLIDFSLLFFTVLLCIEFLIVFVDFLCFPQKHEYVLFDVPRLRTKFGETVFSFSGPSAWNAFPTDIRDETCTAAFKRKLKTFYFSHAFDCI